MLRSRPGASGENFTVHWKALPRPGAAGALAEAEAPGAAVGVLLLSVPKRHLRRAIDRNLARRIARESWRGAGLAVAPVAILVKLRRKPEWFAAAGVRRRRRGLREELDGLFNAPALARFSGTLRGDPRP